MKQEYIDLAFNEHQYLFNYASLLRKTDIAKVEIVDGEIIMTTRADGIKLACDFDDRRQVCLEILNFNSYESAYAQMMYSLLNPGDTILDIGANVGWYSLNIAKKFPKAKVFAFEPMAVTHEILLKNIALNNVRNILSHRLGFWREKGSIEFFFEPEYKVRASAANLSGRDDLESVTVQVQRLDDFVAEQNIRVDLIKCDCEGAELMVFQGAKQTISSCRPVIFTEMLRKWSAKFNYHPNDLISYFAGFGYRCYSVCKGALTEMPQVTNETVETNFVFLHSEFHGEHIEHLARGSVTTNSE